jgi:hypothetical protein
MTELDQTTIESADHVVDDLIGLTTVTTGDNYRSLSKIDQWDMVLDYLVETAKNHGGDLLATAVQIAKAAPAEFSDQFEDAQGNYHIVMESDDGPREEFVLPRTVTQALVSAVVNTIEELQAADRLRERRLRAAAKRKGLLLSRSRERISLDNLGLFRLLDGDRRILAGERFDLTLDAVEGWLSGTQADGDDDDIEGAPGSSFVRVDITHRIRTNRFGRRAR